MEIVSSQEHDADLELGLGLSLGGCCGSGGGGGVKILTAQDLPSVTTTNKHSGGGGGGVYNISGNKRAAADSPGSPPPVSQVVGWPPIRTYRINNLSNQTTKAEQGKKIFGNDHDNNNDDKTNNDSFSSKKPGSLDKSKALPVRGNGQIGFVKVYMDGVQIGRKIDLNAHACYDTLAQTIQDMFLKANNTSTSSEITSARGGGRDVQHQVTKRSSKLLEGSSEFVLVYEDKEGDWMLVGDVPWGMFLSTIKRLRIMRTCEANGLSCCSKISRKKFGQT